MSIVTVDNEIKDNLKKSNFSPDHLDNCLNSRFLSIEKNNSKIIASCFVGGMLNFNGIEILEEFRGKGLGKKLLNEIVSECKRKNLPFITGVFKSGNIVSIKAHTNIGYKPTFTCYYNKTIGREIFIILPFNKKGKIIGNFCKVFNTRIGNAIFAISFFLLNPFLKNIMTFTGDTMPKIDLSYSLRNFEKVQDTMNEVYSKSKDVIKHK